MISCVSIELCATAGQMQSFNCCCQCIHLDVEAVLLNSVVGPCHWFVIQFRPHVWNFIGKVKIIFYFFFKKKSIYFMLWIFYVLYVLTLLNSMCTDTVCAECIEGVWSVKCNLLTWPFSFYILQENVSVRMVIFFFSSENHFFWHCLVIVTMCHTIFGVTVKFQIKFDLVIKTM